MRSRSRIIRLREEVLPGEQHTERLSREEVQALLCDGDIQDGSLVPWGSNYTYYVTLHLGEKQLRAVYKPRKGEAPLIDFPSGTLYLREYASFLTSEWLGWNLVPQTAVREGPYGMGTIQQYIQPEGPPHVYAFGPGDAEQLQKLVVFDLLVNNADRKPAHCFKGPDGGLWAIDHGLTFHPRPKLRTVIWDFCGEAIPEVILRGLETLRVDEERVAELDSRLEPLLTGREVEAFWRRYDSVLERRVYPQLDPRYNIPYGFA
ncbi:MAG: SCO1664 family protein [Chloroflexota bacterium]|nr:SCO1664 family protein [Chloroflexota bacterium]